MPTAVITKLNNISVTVRLRFQNALLVNQSKTDWCKGYDQRNQEPWKLVQLLPFYFLHFLLVFCILDLVFCSCMHLLRIMACSCISVAVKDMISFLFMATENSMVCMLHISFIQSTVDGHLGWFLVFVSNEECCDEHMSACGFFSFGRMIYFLLERK